eukprot:scaffold14386_cov23-Tisochrysis_lutea.AAC.2
MEPCSRTDDGRIRRRRRRRRRRRGGGAGRVEGGCACVYKGAWRCGCVGDHVWLCAIQRCRIEERRSKGNNAHTFFCHLMLCRQWLGVRGREWQDCQGF